MYIKPYMQIGQMMYADLAKPSGFCVQGAKNKITPFPLPSLHSLLREAFKPFAL